MTGAGHATFWALRDGAGGAMIGGDAAGPCDE